MLYDTQNKQARRTTLPAKTNNKLLNPDLNPHSNLRNKKAPKKKAKNVGGDTEESEEQLWRPN